MYVYVVYASTGQRRVCSRSEDDLRRKNPGQPPSRPLGGSGRQRQETENTTKKPLHNGYPQGSSPPSPQSAQKTRVPLPPTLDALGNSFHSGRREALQKRYWLHEGTRSPKPKKDIPRNHVSPLQAAARGWWPMWPRTSSALRAP